MNKKEFLEELEKRLQALPKEEIQERLQFYSEAIDDRVEEGETEEQAIEEIGTLDEITWDIVKKTPLVTLVKEKVKPKRQIRAWEIVLIILGFPVWFPLLITGLVLLFVAYLLTWVFTIVAYVIEASFAVAAVGGLIGFFGYIFSGEFSLIPLGASIACLGASILFAFVCYYITKGNIKLSKNIFIWIKRRFMRKAK